MRKVATERRPCPDFVLGFSSANSVGNINTAKSILKNRRQFASRLKGYPPLGTGSCLNYTSIHLFLFLFFTGNLQFF